MLMVHNLPIWSGLSRNNITHVTPTLQTNNTMVLPHSQLCTCCFSGVGIESVLTHSAPHVIIVDLYTPLL